jgi:geranylgeranyl pyrophosphate synthase
MDDDDLRRGQPTCHRAFDEATAILAGDALQSLAFEVLAGPLTTPTTKTLAHSANANAAQHTTAQQQMAQQRLALIQVLARASGTSGMAAGQALDLAATGQALDLPAIQQIHRLKTGCLLEASIEMAARVVPAVDPADLTRLKAFGAHIGLAFQVQDDILDETGDTTRLGKQAGADQALSKATFPAIMGLSAAQDYVADLLAAALSEVSSLSFEAERLEQIARFIVMRDH